MGDYYYAFPTTSKIYDNKYRYENEKVLINGMSSLVRIHELYILPKENLLEIPRVVSRMYNINKDKILTYYTRINQCSLDRIDICSWLLDRPILKNQKDYTKVKNLMPGMVIDTFFGGESVRMVILENNNNEIKALYGDVCIPPIVIIN